MLEVNLFVFGRRIKSEVWPRVRISIKHSKKRIQPDLIERIRPERKKKRLMKSKNKAGDVET